MIEYLDYYDETGNHLGFKTREEIHQEGLWHNTVHCWLYDEKGYVYFQIRKDSNKFYTTASGHVLKGETVKEAFQREIKEEIGLNIDSSDATLVDIVTWKMDKIKKDGSIFKDRAKANVYIDLFEGSIDNLSFDKNEVLGLVKVNVNDVLDLFTKENGEIKAIIIKEENNQMIEMEKNVNFKDFLVMEHETALEKYGKILDKIAEITKTSLN